MWMKHVHNGVCRGPPAGYTLRSMSRHNDAFDAVIIGAGPGGETCAGLLAKAGRKVAIVERERVGGECAFWGCMPTKVLLRSAVPALDARRVPGSRQAACCDLSFDAAAKWRTDMVGGYDDSDHVPWLRDQGIELVRADATIEGRGRVRAGDRELRAKEIVVASGSETDFPPVKGLRDGPVWTNREASAATSVPRRLAVIGAGAVGIELAHVFAHYGSAVTVIDSADRVLSTESEGLAQLVADSLRSERVALRCASTLREVRWHDDAATLTFDGGDPVEADRVLVASGRRGRSSGLGVERAGGRVEDGRIAIDDRCRAGDGLWAIGDVAGEMMFTHVAKHHAHVAAANILGRDRRVDMRAVPRSLYSDPDAAAVGLTLDQARRAGVDCEVKRSDFDALSRSKTYYEDGTRGAVEVIVDRSRGVAVGAWAFGPLASEWIGILTVAIAANVPVAVLGEVLFAYPTFSEAIHNALATE